MGNEHGHYMVMEYINADNSIQDKTLVEIGSTREIVSPQDSSKHFYNLSKKLKFKFITVDMNPENIYSLRDRFTDINAVHQRGEDFLEGHNSIIDYLYLDAFDFMHDGHTAVRQKAYKDNLGTSINDHACHQMHLDCVKSAYKKITPNGYIIIDDCFGDNFERGKGVTAIPFLLSNGYIIDKKLSQCVALKNTRL